MVLSNLISLLLLVTLLHQPTVYQDFQIIDPVIYSSLLS